MRGSRSRRLRHSYICSRPKFCKSWLNGWIGRQPTSSMPNTEVIRHVIWNAHLRPIISVRIPNPKAPILRTVNARTSDGKWDTHARPTLEQVKIRPCFPPGTPISWLYHMSNNTSYRNGLHTHNTAVAINPTPCAQAKSAK